MTSMSNGPGMGEYYPLVDDLPPGVGDPPSVSYQNVPPPSMSQPQASYSPERSSGSSSSFGDVSESYDGGGIFDPEVIGPPEDDDAAHEVQGGQIQPYQEHQDDHQYGPGVDLQYDPQMDQYDPSAEMYPADPMMSPMSPMSQGYQPMPMMQEPMPMEHAHMLGLSVVGVAIGTLLGQRYGGTYGAVAGAVGAGALINAYRAVHFHRAGTQDSKKEAKVSGTYAVGSAVLGAAIWYKLAKPERMTPNPSKGVACKNPGSCDVRKVGP